MIDAFTIEDCLKKFHEIDLLTRPLVIICNPNKEKELKDTLGNHYLYCSNICVPEDKILVVEREKYETQSFFFL